MGFTQEIQTHLGWKWDTPGALDKSSLDYVQRFGDIVGDLENMAVWHLESQTLVNGVSIHYDLSNLTREVLEADIITPFSKVFGLMVVNLNTVATGGILTVGDADWDEWHDPFGKLGDTARVMPNSPLLFFNRDGWPVGALGAGESSSSGEGEADRMLKLVASAADVVYSIAITGAITDLTESSSSSGA